MCNLYSITKGQAAIIAFARAMRDLSGNLPQMPGVFPDYPAPIVRNAPDGARELMLARWTTDQPLTNPKDSLFRQCFIRPPDQGPMNR